MAKKGSKTPATKTPLRRAFDRQIAAGIPQSNEELPPKELNRRLAFLLLMCGHATLFLETFPTRGRATTEALIADGWFKKGELPDDVIDALTEPRAAFLEMQRVWKRLAPYRDPPCPTRKVYEKLVKFMREDLA